MTKFEKAMAQVNDWIAIAEQDGDMPLARNLKHAREVLSGYSKLSDPRWRCDCLITQNKHGRKFLKAL